MDDFIVGNEVKPLELTSFEKKEVEEGGQPSHNYFVAISWLWADAITNKLQHSVWDVGEIEV